jgi:hypothetical protein
LRNRLPRLSIPLAVATILVTDALALCAQDAASPKFTAFAGAGLNVTQHNSRGEIQTGASFDEAPPGSWGGYLFEGGYVGPWANLHEGAAFASADYMASWSLGQKGRGRTASGQPYWSDRGWKLLPFARAGYTRLFGTGNAVNFGGGFDYRFSHAHAVRAEAVDYYSFSTSHQHNVALRIGFVIYLRD